MARTQWIGIAALGLALTGCVSQEKYAALKLERDQLASSLGKAQSEITLAQGQAEILQQQLNAIRNADGSTSALYANLMQQKSDLERQLADANARYQGAMDKIGQMGTQLTQPLTNELTAFAQQNSDLVDFDAARGIVKFKSDVTFRVGSAEVSDKAKSVLARFADICNSATASGYDLMIAGHTDNQKVSNPATISAGHKDNWYLSAHRGITVAAELFNHKVSSNRLSIAGYADQRPVSSNATETGRALNRRVEVLILPSSTRTASSGTTSGFAAQSSTPVAEKAAPKKAPVLLNKDMTSVDTKSAIPSSINK